MDISLFVDQNEGVKKIYEAILKDGRTFVVTNETLYAQGNFPEGNISLNKVSSETGVKYFLRIKDTSGPRSFNIEELLGNNTVTTNYIQDAAVTTSKIEDASITGEKIKNDSIKNSHLKSESVTSDKIKSEAIKTSHFSKNSIEGSILVSIDGDKIEDRTITTEKYQLGSVSEEILAEKSISKEKLQYDCILSNHISENAIKSIHLASGVILGKHLSDKCIKENNIDLLAIATKHLQNASITGQKIALNALTNSHFSIDCIAYKNLDATLKKSINNSIQLVNNKYTISNDIVSTANIDVNKITTKILQVNDSAVFKTSIQVDGNVNVKGDVVPIGKTYHAFYEDLAEAYTPGEKLEPGDIVEIRNDKKVYKTQGYSDRVVGVVSDQYAACFGALPEEIFSGKMVPVGLVGKVPVKVFGRTVIGQYIEPGKDGIGHPSFNKRGSYIGKAIESKSCEGVGYVKCLIFPN